MGDRRTAPTSFGRREEPPPEPDPTPVMHVGEVRAELVLTVSEETLHAIGSQIASMVANATRQGFDAGLDLASAEIAADLTEPPTAEQRKAAASVAAGVNLDKL